MITAVVLNDYLNYGGIGGLDPAERYGCWQRSEMYLDWFKEESWAGRHLIFTKRKTTLIEGHTQLGNYVTPGGI